jgi:hypothetical protein
MHAIRGFGGCLTQQPFGEPENPAANRRAAERQLHELICGSHPNGDQQEKRIATKTPPNKRLKTLLPSILTHDFEEKNLTAYGGLLTVATMLERLGFQQRVEETLTVKRVPRARAYTCSSWRWCQQRDFRGSTTCDLWRVNRLIDRLRAIASEGRQFGPVLATPLRE